MKVTLLQSVWSTVRAGTRSVAEPNATQCLPATCSSRCIVPFDPYNKPSCCPYNSITAGLRNAKERISYEIRNDLRLISVFEVVPWITSFLARLQRRRPEFDPRRSSAGTGFAPSPSSHQCPILTSILLQLLSEAEPGGTWEISKFREHKIGQYFHFFSSFGLLKTVIYQKYKEGSVARPRHVSMTDAAHTTT